MASPHSSFAPCISPVKLSQVNLTRPLLETHAEDDGTEGRDGYFGDYGLIPVTRAFSTVLCLA